MEKLRPHVFMKNLKYLPGKRAVDKETHKSQEKTPFLKESKADPFLLFPWKPPAFGGVAMGFKTHPSTVGRISASARNPTILRTPPHRRITLR